MNVRRMHTTKTDCGTICFEAHWFKVHFTNKSMGDKRNIIDDDNAFLFTILLDELRGIHWEEH